MTSTLPAPSTARVLVGAAGVTTVGVLPAFLTGAQAVQLQRELGIGADQLGLVVAAAWLTASAGSAAMGRLAERIGPSMALRAAALVSAASMAGVGLVASSAVTLALGMVLAGAANSLAQPSANLLLARQVPPARHGLAFAVKQSAIPTATLLGGLAVPVLTLTLGWRAAYLVGAVVAVLAATVVAPSARGEAGSAVARRRPRPLGPLVVLGVGVGLGAAGAGGLATFLVSGAVDAGMGEASAGLLLTGGSLVGIVMRLGVGARADRAGGDQLPVVVAMMLIGSMAVAAYGLGVPWVFVMATPVAFGAGWAWPGLFNLSVVRAYPEVPAGATGVSQTGTYLGAGLGPVAVGAVITWGSYPLAWLAAGGFLAAGAAAVAVGRGMLER